MIKKCKSIYRTYESIPDFKFVYKGTFDTSHLRKVDRNCEEMREYQNTFPIDSDMYMEIEELLKKHTCFRDKIIT